jgi:hypothetical protein
MEYMTNATLSSGPATSRRLAKPGTISDTGTPVRAAPTKAAPTTESAPPTARLAGVVAGTSWPARLLIGGGLSMIPWLAYLAAALPAAANAAHWDAVWVGFDSAEAAGLLATGVLLRLGDARRSLTAAVTATLLGVDAWFDCGTAAPGADRLVAVSMAAGLEIPLSGFLAVIAWRAFPKAAK